MTVSAGDSSLRCYAGAMSFQCYLTNSSVCRFCAAALGHVCFRLLNNNLITKLLSVTTDTGFLAVCANQQLRDGQFTCQKRQFSPSPNLDAWSIFGEGEN